MKDDDLLDHLRAVISEHAINWAFVIVTEDDELYCDWSSVHTAEGLFKKAMEGFNPPVDIDWDEEEYT